MWSDGARSCDWQSPCRLRPCLWSCLDRGLHSYLSKNVEGKGIGGVKKGHTRGVCHIVWRWHLRGPTGPHSGQLVSPPVLPWREKGHHGFLESPQSLSMSGSRSLLHCTQFDFILDYPLTGLVCLKTLFVQLLQLGVDCLSVFMLKSFHSTQQFHSPSMSQPNKGGMVRLTLSLELKNEKHFFHWIFPVRPLSPHVQMNFFPLFFVVIYIKIRQNRLYSPNITHCTDFQVFRRSVSWTLSPIKIINWLVGCIVPGPPRLIQLKRHCLLCITFIFNNYKWTWSSSMCFLLPMWGLLLHSYSVVINV